MTYLTDCEQLGNDPSTYCEACREYIALRAERDALRADAERYRYLRDHCYKQKWPNDEHDHAMHLSFTVSGLWWNNRDPAVLNGCIDYARSKA